MHKTAEIVPNNLQNSIKLHYPIIGPHPSTKLVQMCAVLAYKTGSQKSMWTLVHTVKPSAVLN